MKTKYKILLVVVIFITIFFFIRLPLPYICDAVTENFHSDCKIILYIHNATAIHVTSSHVWGTGDGIGTWTGTAEGIYHETPVDYVRSFHDNSGVIFYFIIIPSVIILAIMYRGRK